MLERSTIALPKRGRGRPAATTKLTAKDRVIFALELRPEAQVIDPLRALRKALKILLRAYGLRCIAIEEHLGTRRSVISPQLTWTMEKCHEHRKT